MRIKQIMYSVLAVVLLIALWGIPSMFRQEKKEVCPMVCLGDSMLGQVRNEFGVVGLLEQKLGCSVFNGALGGTKMSRINGTRELAYTQDCLSMVALAEAISYGDFGPQQSTIVKDFGTEYFEETIDTLARIDFSQVEVLFIEHGTNDYNFGVPLLNEEDAYDIYTYTGALRSAITTLQEKFPKMRIILVTPTYCWFPEWGHTCETWKPAGVTLRDYVEAEKQIAEELGVEVIDNYPLFSHTSEEDCYRYTVDGLHPNDLGRELIAVSIADYLSENP